jgi:hypothetical protein
VCNLSKKGQNLLSRYKTPPKKKSWKYAEVETFVAGSLEAGGLPGYPEVLISLK